MPLDSVHTDDNVVSSQISSKHLIIANWIEQGFKRENIIESRKKYLEKIQNTPDCYFACILGMALIGKYGSAEDAIEIFWRTDRINQFVYYTFVHLLEMRQEEIERIDYLYVNDESVDSIVFKLRSGTLWN